MTSISEKNEEDCVSGHMMIDIRHVQVQCSMFCGEIVLSKAQLGTKWVRMVIFNLNGRDNNTEKMIPGCIRQCVTYDRNN